jgi:uncharacterized membrane protein
MVNRMSQMASQIGWWNAISRRVHERDVRRQILYNNVRKAARRNYVAQLIADRVPDTLQEFLKMLAGSLLGFWLISKLLVYTLRVRPLYMFAALGLIYSLQATYYKYRLAANPEYKIPRCKCAGRRNDNTELVLRSRESAIGQVPHSLLGAVFYVTLMVVLFFGQPGLIVLLASAGIAVSGYLSYVMVIKIRDLCVNCINVAALNVLILLHALYR